KPAFSIRRLVWLFSCSHTGVDALESSSHSRLVPSFCGLAGYRPLLRKARQWEPPHIQLRTSSGQVQDSYFQGDMKMYKWKLALSVLAIALFAAWYAFRPERLVVDHRINEGFPAAQGGSSPQIIESGTFYGVVHPTTGTATIYRLGDG